MAYKTLVASPGGYTVANRAAAIAAIHTQLLAMGWTLVDSYAKSVSAYGNLVPYTAITTGSPGTILYSLHWTCRKLARYLTFSISHVPREDNSEANRLAHSAVRKRK